MNQENETDKQKQALTMILFAQNVATVRNVSMKKRYLAMAEDLALLIEGEQPRASWKITKWKTIKNILEKKYSSRCLQ